VAFRHQPPAKGPNVTGMTEPAYCFRIRMDLPRPSGLGIDASTLTVSVTDVGEVALTSLDGNTLLSQAGTVVISGPRFPTESEASDAAARVRSCLQVALARIGIGADFGDRRPGGEGMSGTDRARVLREQGKRYMNNVHGTQVYECDPPPTFVAAPPVPSLAVVSPPGAFENAFEAAAARPREPNPSLEVAYDLFAASFFVTGQADARFLILMMAVEAMLEFERRPPTILAHVENVIEATRKLEIPADEEAHRKALLTTLERQRDESIGHAGRRLARTLGNRTYGWGRETPEKFFSSCYTIRSRLVHPSQGPLPPRDEVDYRAASLQGFVAHLLSREILDVVSIVY
jgi:hypothetical protein